jgi:biopolymer transport protein ExbB/TolQ
MRDDAMDAADRPHSRPPIRLTTGGDPVLSWMVFTALAALAFILLWFYGLAQKALSSDPTHITSCIALIYIAASLHCLWRALAVAREAEAGRNLARAIAGSASALAAANDPRHAGFVARHIRDLATKSELAGDGQHLDQTVLLRVLAARLSGGNSFGASASDLSMKLGLFGTVVGFIMMLAPIAGLGTEDQAALKSSVALMSEGMAVAMYTTLAGLIGAILIKIQYQFVESATARLFTSAVALTEVYVIPVLERRAAQAQ